MLQDLTRSPVLVAPKARRGRAAAPARRAAPASPATPTGPDLDECSPAYLAELSDLAYRAGDRASAEYFIRRLYAAHDRRRKSVAAAGQQTEATAQLLPSA